MSSSFTPTLFPGMPGKPHGEVEGAIKLVTKEELKEHPYQSVGKLYWAYSRTDIRYASAFYIDERKIMTVAHVFYDYSRDVYTKEAS